MNFITVTKKTYEDVVRELGQYLAQSPTCDQTCRIESLPPILDKIRTLQFLENNVLYPSLEKANIGDAIKKAQEQHAAIETQIDNLIFIHVDEPEHLHLQRVAELKDMVENMNQLSTMILDICPAYLSEQEQKDINEQLTKITMKGESQFVLNTGELVNEKALSS